MKNGSPHTNIDDCNDWGLRLYRTTPLVVFDNSLRRCDILIILMIVIDDSDMTVMICNWLGRLYNPPPCLEPKK